MNTTPIRTARGVRLWSPATESYVDIPWRGTNGGPYILRTSLTGGNVLTEWDVDWWIKVGHPCHPLNMGYPDEIGVTTRKGFDRQHRERRGRNTRLTLSMEEAAECRTKWWSGGWRRAVLADLYRISVPTLDRLIAGRDYWWCGGGLGAWWFKRREADVTDQGDESSGGPLVRTFLR